MNGIETQQDLFGSRFLLFLGIDGITDVVATAADGKSMGCIEATRIPPIHQKRYCKQEGQTDRN